MENGVEAIVFAFDVVVVVFSIDGSNTKEMHKFSVNRFENKVNFFLNNSRNHN